MYRSCAHVYIDHVTMCVDHVTMCVDHVTICRGRIKQVFHVHTLKKECALPALLFVK